MQVNNAAIRGQIVDFDALKVAGFGTVSIQEWLIYSFVPGPNLYAICHSLVSVTYSPNGYDILPPGVLVYPYIWA